MPDRNIPTSNPAAVKAQKLYVQGLAFHQKGELKKAASLYERALEAQPRHFDALHSLGILAALTKDYQRAVSLIERAIEINPTNPMAYYNCGSALKALKQLDAAVASYDKAIALQPDFAEAYDKRGLVLHELKQLDAAVESYDKAIALKPDYAVAYCDRANALQELKRLEAAVASYRKAIAFKPDFAMAYNNLGNALQDLGQLDAAVESYDRAIAIKQDYAIAYYNRGNALQDLKQLDAAVASYDKAIACKTDFAQAYKDRGNALQGLKQLDAALASYNKVISIDPNFPFGKGALLHAKMLCCEWEGLAELYESVFSEVGQLKESIEPFGYQGICDDENSLKLCAEIYTRKKHPGTGLFFAAGKKRFHDKIRIGYVCGEFREQATSRLMTEVWELHDKDNFEIYAFDNGWDDNSPRRERIEQAFGTIYDISRMSDRQAANLILEKKIDILLNLNGFFGLSRQGVFACKPAPIQINYLGFPGTMGAGYIDYLIADECVIPVASRQHYSEKIIYLPDSYQANDRKILISDRKFTREELGLPPESFVFCCFNNNYKITPSTFDSWIRVLKAVDGSVLWLLEDNTVVVRNLRAEAERRGVNGDRLVFAKRITLPEHLARHRNADLFLDTLPYNAHTTASDALWAGLPVLTLIGRSFAGRVAASLLNAVGMSELITFTRKEYEDLAIELAKDPKKLAAIKNKLVNNRLTTPLFDTPLFVKHIEAAYREMYERYQADLPPEHISIND